MGPGALAWPVTPPIRLNMDASFESTDEPKNPPPAPVVHQRVPCSRQDTILAAPWDAEAL